MGEGLLAVTSVAVGPSSVAVDIFSVVVQTDGACYVCRLRRDN